MPYQQIDKEHYPQLYKNKRQRVVLSAIGTDREQGAHLQTGAYRNTNASHHACDVIAASPRQMATSLRIPLAAISLPGPCAMTSPRSITR